MLSLVRRIREAVGFGIDLAFDAHWRYRAKEMLIVARELEPYRIAWLEDPLPMSDLEGFRERTATPIATGENHQLLTGFYPLITARGCDIVMPDLQKSGGLLDAKNIAGLAQKFNMPFAPHMIGSPLAMMTTAQFSATVPNFLAMEFHGFDVPFYFDIVGEEFQSWFRPGEIILPDPCYGIGLELNMKEARKYVEDSTAVFE